MFDRIVLLSEPHPVAAAALRRAVSLARPSAQVDVLALVHDPHLDGYLGHREIYESLRERLLEEARERAERLAGDLQVRGVRASAAAVWDAPPHEALARHVASGGVQLVIKASPGRHGPSHADWRTIAACPAPVLVVRSDGERPWRSIVAAVDPFHAHSKPAELDPAILGCARALQERTRAEVKAVYCFVPLTDIVAQSFIEDVRLAEAEKLLEAERRDAVLRLATDAGLPASAAQIAPGRPEDVLLDMAARGEADLLVMGALSRGRLKDLVIGSTAERVLHRAEIDVLLLKPPRLEPL